MEVHQLQRRMHASAKEAIMTSQKPRRIQQQAEQGSKASIKGNKSQP